MGVGEFECVRDAACRCAESVLMETGPRVPNMLEELESAATPFNFALKERLREGSVTNKE